jgi:ATP-dependent exoDNAse (exonuclease V) beta subunit
MPVNAAGSFISCCNIYRPLLSTAAVPWAQQCSLQMLIAQDGTERSIIGRVDRFVASDNDLLIADFKLSDNPHPSLAAILQLALYRAVLMPLWPSKNIRALLIHTSGPTIHHLSSGTLDAALQRYLAEPRPYAGL